MEHSCKIVSSQEKNLSSLREKYEKETHLLQQKIEKKFHADLIQLFKKRLFSDLCIVTRYGAVYFHKAIVATRCPVISNLVNRLNLLQKESGLSKLNSHSIPLKTALAIHLPDATYGLVKQFVESLYSDGDIKGLNTIKRIIQERIEWLLQVIQLKKHNLSIQPLDKSISKQIHQEIWEQLNYREVKSRNSTPGLVKKKTKLNSSTEFPSISKSYHADESSQAYGASLSTRKKHISSVVSLETSTTSVDTTNEHPLEVIELDAYLQKYNHSDHRNRSGTYTIRKGRSRLPIPFFQNAPEVLSSEFSLTKQFLSTRSKNSNESFKSPIFSTKPKDESSFYLNDIMKMENDSGLSNKSDHNSQKCTVTENVRGDLMDGVEVCDSTVTTGKASTSATNDANVNCHEVMSPDSQQEGIPNSSSMEVELASSTASHESDQMNIASSENSTEIQDPSFGSQKPLVRTRTFEVIERSPGTSDTKNVHNLHRKSSLSSAAEGGTSNTDTVVLRKHKQQRNFQSDCQYPEGSYQHENENPNDMREIERMKGSFLFENNFQTFSNIPQTNLMSSANLVSGSLSSDSSIGISSLFGSMHNSSLLSSIHSTSVGGEPLSRPPSVALSSIACNDEFHDPSNKPPIPSIRNDRIRTMNRNSTEYLKNHDSSSKSPSPDSLNVEQHKHLRKSFQDTDSLMSGRTDTLKCSIDSSLSGNKEDLDDEVKEQDDSEILLAEPLSLTKESVSSFDKIQEMHDKGPLKQSFQITSDNSSSNSSSPKIIRRAEHTPILSGGSTLKRQKSNEKQENNFERQISSNSVKDVDSIPLVCGFVENLVEDNDHEQSAKKEPDSQPQSIFSMFIDLKELPSPDKKEKKNAPIPVKEKPNPQSLYMFIDANEDTPKVKPRRRLQSESAGTQDIKEKDSINSNKLPEPNSHTHLEKQEKDFNDTCNVEVKDEDDVKKKGFFVFIEADANSNSSSPKIKRKPPILSSFKKSTKDTESSSSIMSKSAPSDVLLLTTKNKPGYPEKLCSRPLLDGEEMTKSVIDRKEFMEQPVAKRNVSLDNKINEASSASPRISRDKFVSAIPRPIHLLKSKSCSKVPRLETHRRSDSARSTRKPGAIEHKPPSGSFKESKASAVGNLHFDRHSSIKRDLDDLTSSLTGSFSEAASSMSLPLDSSISSDASSLLEIIDRRRTPGLADSSSSLGEDLLRMFEEKINTDVVVQVGEKRIPAHKCILASRCVYFAAMLSGRAKDGKECTIVKLQGFSAESVTIALRHIYSGSSSFDEDTDNVSSEELAALSDMLSLDGLKDVVGLYLKAEKCHYFHKPCVGGCIEGVLETLMISSTYSLEELFVKALKWLTKHFIAVLPTKQFATLPQELHERFLKQIQYDLTVSNVIDVVIGGTEVLSSLPVVRWAKPTLKLTTEILDATYVFIATNLSAVIDSEKFKEICINSNDIPEGVEESMVTASRQLTAPDQAVLSHIRLTTLLQDNDYNDDNGSQSDQDSNDSQNIKEFLQKILTEVENFLVNNSGRASVCRQWPLLPVATQRKIKEAAQGALLNRFSSGLPPQPHRPRVSSVGSKSFKHNKLSLLSDGNKLARSASASNVPPNMQSKHPQTMPAGLNRSKPSLVSTPPPTRASTLRAKQAAMQRGAKRTTDGSSADEISPRSLAQRALLGPCGSSSRPHTPQSRPSSRPLTPAHNISNRHGGSAPTRRINTSKQVNDSEDDSKPSRHQSLSQLNTANNNKVTPAKKSSNESTASKNTTNQSESLTNTKRIPKPPPMVSATNPPPPATRSRTFLKEDT